MPDKKIPILVKTFEEFAMFSKNKWRASLLAMIFIALFGSILLSLFYGYRKIDLLGDNITITKDIVEESQTTPMELQDSLVDSVATSLLIDKELSTTMLVSQNADAALFFKFHNTKVDLQGKHDFFYSGLNEVTRDSSISFLADTQNIPITRLGQYMIPFFENKCQTVVVADMNKNIWLKAKLQDDDINTLVTCPIYDVSQRLLLGFVEVVYLGEDGPARPLEVVENCISKAAHGISNIISNEEITNINK